MRVVYYLGSSTIRYFGSLPYVDRSTFSCKASILDDEDIVVVSRNNHAKRKNTKLHTQIGVLHSTHLSETDAEDRSPKKEVGKDDITS